MAIVDPVFPLIEVSGSAYQMGYQHGEQAARLIGKYILWIEKLAHILLKDQTSEEKDGHRSPIYRQGR